jgi:hypothetical protein
MASESIEAKTLTLKLKTTAFEVGFGVVSSVHILNLYSLWLSPVSLRVHYSSWPSWCANGVGWFWVCAVCVCLKSSCTT